MISSYWSNFSSTDAAIIFPPKEPRILQRQSRHRSGSHLRRFSSQVLHSLNQKWLAFGFWVLVFWLQRLSIGPVWILAGVNTTGRNSLFDLELDGFDIEECPRLSSLSAL
jgi:hypothetical protein